MKNQTIHKTDNTPEVILDYERGLIEFEGKSYPENTFNFYKPILLWMREYFSGKCQNSTTVNIKLTYFNSGTTQILFDILDTINEGTYQNLVINWYHDEDNENGLEDYEDFSHEFKTLNIQTIAYKK